MQFYRKIRIFVSSTGEVEEEAESVRRVVRECSVLGDHLGIVLESQDWHQVLPGAGPPQRRIFEQLKVREWDIFIGILGNRFGQPTGETDPKTGNPYLSGVEQEFKEAYREWIAKGSPHILFYHCPYKIGQDPVDAAGAEALAAFFGEFAPDGTHPGLYRRCDSPSDFLLSLWPDLQRLLVAQAQETNPTVDDIARRTTKNGLQAVVKEFDFSQRSGARHITVNVGRETPFLHTSAQRRAFSEWQSENKSAKAQLSARIKKIVDRPDAARMPIDCRACPLRYVSGGVLPVVRLRNSRSTDPSRLPAEYYLLFFRVSSPVGWNIANGGAMDSRELQDPTLIIYREFGEEVMIVDHDKQTLYMFDPVPGVKQPGYQSEALGVWRGHLPDGPYELERFNVSYWEEGPDTVHAKVYGESKASSGVYVNVTPDDNAIEVDRVALLDCNETVAFLDGDVSEKRRIGRIVGLFRVDTFPHVDDDCKFLPDLWFFQGVRYGPSKGREDDRLEMFHATLKAYFDAIGKDFPANVSDYPRLCPITKELIGRYQRRRRSGR